jgi:2-polyprenyl-3-methyl-5-hydroxy-6-metoxy-1,4-benzoquinol methylase
LDDLETYYRDIYWTLIGHKLSHDEIHSKEEERAIRQAELFPEKEEVTTLLDVGCGNGYFIRLMDEKGYACVGQDLDPKAANWPLVYSSIEDIPEEAQFDWITMSHVLEHVPYPIEWLEEFHRLKAPHGKIFIEVPSFSPAKGVFSLHHVGGYTIHTLQTVAMKAGFHVEWIRFLPKIEDVGGTIVLQMIVR